MAMTKFLKLGVAVLFIGCKTPIDQINKVEEKTDNTVKVAVESVKSPVLNSYLVVERLCDSTTGLPSNLKVGVSSGKNTGFIEIKGNSLFTSINIDSIKSEAIREFKSSYKINDYYKKETERIIVTPKWAWYSLSANAIVVLFLGLYIGFKIKGGWVGIFKWFK